MSLTRAQVRNVDHRAIDEYGLPGIVLMENAGRGAVELLVSLGITGPVAVCCGKGNNGGDGFVMARRLDLLGFDVRILLCIDPSEFTGDAAVNYRVLEKAGLAGRFWRLPGEAEQFAGKLAEVEWIVDALLGTGANGIVRDPLLTAIERINSSGRKVLAVDLPSGLDCDTGEPLGACVQAAATATFVARKAGFDAPGSRRFTGAVHVVDIGIPRKLLDETLSESGMAGSVSANGAVTGYDQTGVG